MPSSSIFASTSDLAATYHAGRDVFPHGRRGRIRFHEEGAAFVPLELAGRLQFRAAVSSAG
jgi:hypothetical protein